MHEPQRCEPVSIRLLLKHAGKRSIGVRFSSERVVRHREATLLRFVARRLLYLEQRGFAVTAGQPIANSLLVLMYEGLSSVHRQLALQISG
jgi:hypothetical protein